MTQKQLARKTTKSGRTSVPSPFKMIVPSENMHILKLCLTEGVFESNLDEAFRPGPARRLSDGDVMKGYGNEGVFFDTGTKQFTCCRIDFDRGIIVKAQLSETARKRFVRDFVRDARKDPELQKIVEQHSDVFRLGL
ncbi:MAG: hypothetical protein AABW86_05050 [Candidatus Micrarchaeota archaeon]